MTTAEQMLWVLMYRDTAGYPSEKRALMATEEVLEFRKAFQALPRTEEYDEVFDMMNLIVEPE